VKSVKKATPRELVLQVGHLTGRRRGAILKEEIWYEGETVAKYSLAYINSRICGQDNGRVLGYDNSHGEHHRHFREKTELTAFSTYEELAQRFEREVRELWRIEDEQS
jgi:hypothetical protein